MAYAARDARVATEPRFHGSSSARGLAEVDPHAPSSLERDRGRRAPSLELEGDGLRRAVSLALVVALALPILVIRLLGFWTALSVGVLCTLGTIAIAVAWSCHKQGDSSGKRWGGRLFALVTGLSCVLVLGKMDHRSQRPTDGEREASAPGSRAALDARRLHPHSTGEQWAVATRAERWRVCRVMATAMCQSAPEISEAFLYEALSAYLAENPSSASLASIAGLCVAEGER